MFLMGSIGIVYRSPITEKYAYPCTYGSYDTIHTLKNYFITIFLIINFQFLASKWHLNIPLHAYSHSDSHVNKARKTPK